MFVASLSLRLVHPVGLMAGPSDDAESFSTSVVVKRASAPALRRSAASASPQPTKTTNDHGRLHTGCMTFLSLGCNNLHSIEMLS